MRAALLSCLHARRVGAPIAISITRAFTAPLVTALFLAVLPPGAGAQPRSDDRGRLLYETYCISCHTTQVHWRDSGLAKDWITLKGQIDRWQKTIGQRWTFEQIDDVAQFLNSRFYKFKPEGATRAQTSTHAPPVHNSPLPGPAPLAASQ